MTRVCVRWGSKKLEVDVDVNEIPLVLKAQLFGLTGVPPNRQKLIVKGKTIPDDSWNAIKVDQRTIMLLMGSVEAPAEATSDQSAANGKGPAGGRAIDYEEEEEMVMPMGLNNLGNTCYLSSTLQCFKLIPELVQAVDRFKSNNPVYDHYKPIIENVRNLYDSMDENRGKMQAVPPIFMLEAVHRLFPQFGARDAQGRLMQQDANECFTQILSGISDATTFGLQQYAQEGTSTDGEKLQEPKPIKLRKVLEIEIEATLKCLESGEEPIEKVSETQIQLSCYPSQDVRYLQSGIKSKMTEEIEKNSPTLKRNARYEKKALISRLPAYLSIQMVRFYFKELDGINAKVLRDVKFPINLDVFDLCTPELQAKLRPVRDAFKEYEDAMLEMDRKSKIDTSQPMASDETIKSDYVNRDNNEQQMEENKPTTFQPSSFADDPGSNNSGHYELKALITHKGRSSNSGHYVAWVRLKSPNDGARSKIKNNNLVKEQSKWAMCDDDDVYVVSEEDILKLSGGGDHHCAYVLLYGPRKLGKL